VHGSLLLATGSNSRLFTRFLEAVYVYVFGMTFVGRLFRLSWGGLYPHLRKGSGEMRELCR
jgi:hypothetical protein